MLFAAPKCLVLVALMRYALNFTLKLYSYFTILFNLKVGKPAKIKQQNKKDETRVQYFVMLYKKNIFVRICCFICMYT